MTFETDMMSSDPVLLVFGVWAINYSKDERLNTPD